MTNKTSDMMSCPSCGCNDWAINFELIRVRSLLVEQEYSVCKACGDEFVTPDQARKCDEQVRQILGSNEDPFGE